MRRILVVAVCAAALCAGAAQKKAIGCGWGFNNVTVDDFLANADRFNETGLDGVLVWLRGRDGNGKPVGMRNIYTENWTYEMFAPMVPKLRKMTEQPAFRENFLNTLRAPRKRLAWTDDAAWARVAENMRVAACIARDGGCRGLQMDTEDYSHTHQFGWQPGDPRYDELCRLARQRGAEVFRGVFKEYPEAVVLSFWFLSMGNDGCPERCVESSVRARGTVWPAFINGILDVITPKARLVDGNENAYRYEADGNDFYRSACHTRKSLLPLVAPENREKYARQMLVGFGLYLDMYINPTNSPWYFPPTNGSRLETFARNFEQAMDAADEYIWVYGEKRQFVKWPEGFRGLGRMSPLRWEDELPGLSDILFSVKDPDAFARRRRAELEASGAWTNIVPNGDCAVCVAGKVPKPFSSWQPGDKATHRGTFGCDTAFGDGDSTSFCAEGVPSGCFAYTIKGVAPGQMYLVKCSASGGPTSASIAWKNAKGRYVKGTLHMPFGKEEGRWRRGEIAVRVPSGAVGMQIALGVCLAPGEKAWFDSVGVYPLDRR